MPSDAPSSPNARTVERPWIVRPRASCAALESSSAGPPSVPIDAAASTNSLLPAWAPSSIVATAAGRSSITAASPASTASRVSSRIGWMKMWTIPPHISPTVPASSSEMP